MQRRITSVLLLAAVAALIVGIGLQPGMADDHAKDEAKQAPESKADVAVISDPSHEKMNLTAPDSFKALFKTTQGDFTVEVDRSWAPNGADRFYSLVKNGYYDGTRFFRSSRRQAATCSRPSSTRSSIASTVATARWARARSLG